VWGGVPARNLDFTGRRALLARLEQQLRTKSVVAVLPGPRRGMGGVGKSQIASEYLYRHGAEYDVVWWIPAEQPAQVPASVIELGDALGLKVGREVTAASRVLEALWAGSPYSNWLLVFDNAESLAAVRDYLPRWGTGKALVTSRNADWEQLAGTVSVGPFTRAESIQLLRKRNRRLSIEDADTGDTLAGPDLCSGLMFTDFAPEHDCGPFDLSGVPHGRRCVVVLKWSYTGRALLPSGTTKGPEFTW